MRTLSFCALLLVGLTAGCASGKGSSVPSDKTDKNAIVIPESEIHGDVLTAMRNRIPSMRITSTTGRCPHIVFRSEKSIRQQGEPSVYIDETRMIDTCALLDLTDVVEVRVYPSGITPYPQYQRNPYGLILIVRRH